MDHKQNTVNLILKSLTVTLDKEEKKRLETWLSESEENKQEYKAYKELWKKSEKLVVSDEIDVESSLKTTKKRMNIDGGKKRWLAFARQVAAVLVLSVAFAALYHYFSDSQNTDLVYQDVTTSFGIHTNLTLADGTKVWLNSDSHLRFPLSFENLEEREVELGGEAFFEVAQNSDVPFVVNTSDLNIRVLGTSFNVSAYEEIHEITVALKEGQISLLQANSGAGKELLTMNPNEVATFNRQSQTLDVTEDNDFEKYNAWKEGRLAFFDDDIESFVHKLEKWYNVETVVADEAINDYHFTATFTDETLNQALSLLCSSSGLNYKIVPAERKDNGSYTKRKVILSLKKIRE